MAEGKSGDGGKGSKTGRKDRPSPHGGKGAASSPQRDEETPEARGRREAIEAREAQKRILQRAANELGARFGMPGEDEEELQNQRGEIRRMISDLDRELEDLRASQSMKFPGSAEIGALGRAMDKLEARIAASAAATAIGEASIEVMDAFGI